MNHWTDSLRALGYRPGAVLGSGMEGSVVALGDGLVAKVWHRRGVTDLGRLKTFYDGLSHSCLSLDGLGVVRVVDLGAQHATIEKLVPGTPLGNDSEDSSPTLDDRRIRSVVAVLAALAEVEPMPDMGVLPILDGEPPFDTQRMSFEASLASLVERRVDEFRTPLNAALPELAELTAAVIDRLKFMEPSESRLVHGDLVPQNILVNASSDPSAILDFGFMSTIGDPAFDAAVAASVHDMYGPRSLETEAILDDAIRDRFGYDESRMALYRAAYALTTSNCFSASGQDGHFLWCVRMLQRPDIREALRG